MAKHAKITWKKDERGDGANGVDTQGGEYTIRTYLDFMNRRAFRATEPGRTHVRRYALYKRGEGLLRARCAMTRAEAEIRAALYFDPSQHPNTWEALVGLLVSGTLSMESR